MFETVSCWSEGISGNDGKVVLDLNVETAKGSETLSEGRIDDIVPRKSLIRGDLE